MTYTRAFRALAWAWLAAALGCVLLGNIPAAVGTLVGAAAFNYFATRIEVTP